ncbi:MAG: FAD-binding protein [Myxococcales bacterium]|nr:FAD-binding protein [Myxococcales bacterium]
MSAPRPPLPSSVDLIVVGAGTAGAATAAFAAERGLRVVCLDRRPLTGAGARWVNGVTRAALREAGIVPDEGLAEPPRFHLVSAHRRVTVPRHDIVDLDMRALVAQLQARAQAAGATLIGDVAVRGRDGVTVLTDAGPVRGRWIVDASGLAGAGLIANAAVAAEHLCVAAQGVYEVRDRAGAAAYFAARDIPLGEICARVGIAGGFSLLNVRVHPGGDTVGVLTGSIPALGHPGGKALRDEFVRAQPWIGPMIYGGGGAIPLRRPREELTDGKVILVGDTACQVFAAHGSGIGAGILAGKLVAETLAAGGTPFDYEVAWHRRWGGMFAAYDAVRRWNQHQTPDELDAVIARGVFDAELARAGLDQDLPRLSPRALATKLPAALRERGVIELATRTAAALALGRLFPRRGPARRAWSAAMQRLLPV